MRKSPPDNLGSGWHMSGPSAGASGVITTIFNEVSYARFVHGNDVGEGQVEVHQGRWTTVPEAVDREAYLDDLRSAMSDNIGGR